MALAPDFPQRLLIVGCGNMAGAMLHGWIAAGLDPARVDIIDPALRDPPPGARLHAAPPAALAPPDLVLLGIKPQLLDEVAAALAGLDLSAAMLVSILAGVEGARLRRVLPDAGAIVRVMPNMAVRIGKGVLAVHSSEADAAQLGRLTAMLAPLGRVEPLADETLMHAVVALAGSGPAFVYRFIDALGRAGAALGLAEDQAARLALAMVEGSAALAATSDEAPAALAERVASPGGTTRAGLAELDGEDALERLIAATLAAAAQRSRELAGD